MNDEERLELELARMHPAALRGELMDRLAVAADERLTLADRVLTAWTGLGAVAACVIVGIAAWQIALPAPVPTATGPEIAARRSQTVEIERLMASR